MKSIRTKNMFLGVGIFVAFIILQVVIAYKFQYLSSGIDEMKKDSSAIKELYKVYVEELKYQQLKTPEALKELKQAVSKLPAEYITPALTRVNAKNFKGLENFLIANIHSLQKRAESINIDVTHENMVMFIIILIINIIINIALYMFAKQIIDNIEVLKDGLGKFFKYLNREINTVSEIKVLTEDEFRDMADMINKNINLIQKNIQKDVKTVEEIRELSDRMARGDFSGSITETPANPEILELKKALNKFVISIRRTFDSILEILDEYKKEDYQRRLEIDAVGEVRQLVDGVNALGYALEVGASKIAKSLTEKSNALKLTSDNLSQNIDSLSNALARTSKNVDIVSAKTEEITENIKNTVDKINKMKVISDDTKEDALRGEKLALDTLNAMQEIAESTNAIQEAVTIIDSIAFQTNILSLNAAVEAATAGEAGKGFAVVAGEVRNLASKSAAAAKKIKELVTKTETKAAEGIEISDNMKSNFLGVVEKISTTSNYVNDITDGANMEAKKIEEINNSIRDIHAITDDSKAIMKSTYVVTSDLTQIAKELYEEVNKAHNG
ncbi:MAG: hypothetical protein GXO40_05065 [Epsilonproteobacteria bacterium]|nr:hypothetical protein [Campylobacterota bacterium]